MRKIATAKSLSFGLWIGDLPLNVGAAVRLRPERIPSPGYAAIRTTEHSLGDERSLTDVLCDFDGYRDG